MRLGGLTAGEWIEVRDRTTTLARVCLDLAVARHSCSTRATRRS
jgi:hypothetical protein